MFKFCSGSDSRFQQDGECVFVIAIQDLFLKWVKGESLSSGVIISNSPNCHLFVLFCLCLNVSS